MEAIDRKILKELELMPEESKLEVLQFIKNLNASYETFAGAADEHSAKHELKTAVSEDPDEYISTEKLITRVNSLPKDLQNKLWHYLNKLSSKLEEAKILKKKKLHPKFKPGFGGAKGLIIFKDGWDDSLTELFEDYT